MDKLNLFMLCWIFCYNLIKWKGRRKRSLSGRSRKKICCFQSTRRNLNNTTIFDWFTRIVVDRGWKNQFYCHTFGHLATFGRVAKVFVYLGIGGLNKMLKYIAYHITISTKRHRHLQLNVLLIKWSGRAPIQSQARSLFCVNQVKRFRIARKHNCVRRNAMKPNGY